MSNNTKIIANIIKKEDLDEIVEGISEIKLWLLFFVIITVKIIVFQTLKTCRRIYKVHNDKVIRQHTETTSPI